MIDSGLRSTPVLVDSEGEDYCCVFLFGFGDLVVRYVDAG